MSPNLEDFQSWTALHCASYTGHLKQLKYLLNLSEIDLTVTDSMKRTPLMIAIECGHVLGEEK
jgi:ankyrin repeat protein